jgi:hypothetical protein
MPFLRLLAAALVAGPLALAATSATARSSHGAPARVVMSPGHAAPTHMISYHRRHHPRHRHHIAYHRG